MEQRTAELILAAQVREIARHLRSEDAATRERETGKFVPPAEQRPVAEFVPAALAELQRIRDAIIEATPAAGA